MRKGKRLFSGSVTLSEVEDALKTFKRDKAPGPDGWPVEFYLTFFLFIGTSPCQYGGKF